MKRNVKVLVLAVTAVLAMSSISAVADSQAAAPELHVTNIGGGTIKGTSNNLVLTVQGGNVKCVENGGVPGARFESTVPDTGTSATVSAAYGNAGKGCTAFGVAAAVNMKSCDYVVRMFTGTNPPVGLVDVKCSTVGDAITVTASSLPCTLTIGPTVGIGFINWGNVGGAEPTYANADFALENIPYTATGVGCPKAGSFLDGRYYGRVPLRAFNGSGTM